MSKDYIETKGTTNTIELYDRMCIEHPDIVDTYANMLSINLNNRCKSDSVILNFHILSKNLILGPGSWGEWSTWSSKALKTLLLEHNGIVQSEVVTEETPINNQTEQRVIDDPIDIMESTKSFINGLNTVNNDILLNYPKQS